VVVHCRITDAERRYISGVSIPLGKMHAYQELLILHICRMDALSLG
jgi:hypothetical protein